MKTIMAIVSLLYFSLSYGEVWKKPPYTPDENHLPKSEMEKQEEIPSPDKNQPKQHQEDKKKYDEEAIDTKEGDQVNEEER